MSEKSKKKWFSSLLGFSSGVLNGLFGAGGGVAVVPMLEQMDVAPQKAHATSVAIILPLSAVSALLYWINGVEIEWHSLFWLVPTGIIGAVLGAKILKKIPQDFLRRIFGGLIVYSGIRLLFF